MVRRRDEAREYANLRSQRPYEDFGAAHSGTASQRGSARVRITRVADACCAGSTARVPDPNPDRTGTMEWEWFWSTQPIRHPD